jgi:cholesterol oxidase
VGSAVALGIGTHVSVPRTRRLGRGVDGELSIQRDRGLGGKVSDLGLKLRPIQKEERCASPVCRRATYVYGLLYEHDQLNRPTHEALHELLSLPSPGAIAQLRLVAKRGRLVAADGADLYLPHSARLAIPLAFVHGAESEAFRPGGTETTVAELRTGNPGSPVSLHLIPDYGHLDLVIGKNADNDVFPLILDHLNATTAPAAGALVGA